MKYCNQCGTMLVLGATECSSCKTPINNNLPFKYCTECGTYTDSSYTFCSLCGKPTINRGTAATSSEYLSTASAPATANSYADTTYTSYAPKANTPSTFTKVIVTSIALLIIALLAFFFIIKEEHREYDGLFSTLCNAFETGDEDLLAECYPEDLQKYLPLIFSSGFDGKSFSAYIADIKEELGGDFSIDYEIRSEEDLSEEQIDEVKAMYSKLSIDLNIEKGYLVEVSLQYFSHGTVEDCSEEKLEFVIIKVDGKWYLGM